MIDKLSKMFAKHHREFFLMHKIDYPQEELFDEFEKNIIGLLEKSEIRIIGAKR